MRRGIWGSVIGKPAPGADEPTFNSGAVHVPDPLALTVPEGLQRDRQRTEGLTPFPLRNDSAEGRGNTSFFDISPDMDSPFRKESSS